MFIGDGPGETGANLPAVPLGVGRTATAISAGGEFTCALLDNATVKCWGSGSSGRLGTGSTDSVGDGPGEMAALTAIPLGPGRSAVAVTAGQVHTCALLDNDTVKCWGNGTNGRLGSGSTDNLGGGPGEMGGALPAVDLGTGGTPVAVSAGAAHSCVVLEGGAVKCWGNGANGRLGTVDPSVRGDGPGEMGDDLPTVDLGPRRVIGPNENPTTGADVILGRTTPETIDALAGNDRICSRGGGDTVNAGLGDDRAFGAAGKDTLNGSSGRDLLDGGLNNGRLNGGTERDTCHGRAGTDSSSSCEARTGIP